VLADALNTTIEPLAVGSPNLYFVTISVRPGATQPFLYIQRRHAFASVILFTGGTGVLGLSPDGFATTPSNFLVRSRDLFADHNLSVAVVDVPSDWTTLGLYRFSPEHAKDVAGVIEFLRRRSWAPVWLVGTSRGTTSIVSIAAQLHGRAAPDGIVLTSSVVSGTASVFDADLASIRVRTLIVHHVHDGCVVTQYSDVPALVGALTGVRDVRLISVDGGGPPNGDPCEPWGFHGFPGLEAQVVNDIAAYILRARIDPHAH
jgi:hypothetical protein